jgi:hypothetical protein
VPTKRQGVSGRNPDRSTRGSLSSGFCANLVMESVNPKRHETVHRRCAVIWAWLSRQRSLCFSGRQTWNHFFYCSSGHLIALCAKYGLDLLKQRPTSYTALSRPSRLLVPKVSPVSRPLDPAEQQAEFPSLCPRERIGICVHFCAHHQTSENLVNRRDSLLLARIGEVWLLLPSTLFGQPRSWPETTRELHPFSDFRKILPEQLAASI